MPHYEIDGTPIDVSQVFGEEVQTTKAYGVGIDTHSKFIYVTVLVKENFTVMKYDRTFPTTWECLNNAREWIKEILMSKPNPPLKMTEIEPIRYTIESTSVYHLPVLRALGGQPSVVNPLLASPARRKTDALDAKTLAYQNMTGLWPVSYVVGDEFHTLRVLLAQRTTHRKQAAKLSNQINNYLLRFGYTVGRDGSVTQTNAVRTMVEDLCLDKRPEYIEENPEICIDDLPDEMKDFFKEMYSMYDYERQKQKFFERKAIDYAKKMWFPIDGGAISEGKTLIEHLCSVPGVGEICAVTWLSIICDPIRFPNSKAISAFCGLDPSLKVSAGKVTSITKRGGNKDLHILLNNCASVLVRNRKEPFGIWGYQLYMNSQKWKKAVSAVARKICVAMYWVNKKDEPFTYDGYKITTQHETINITLDELCAIEPAFNKYKKLLQGEFIFDTETLTDKYNKCELKHIKGCGKKFNELVHGFIFNQKKYRELYYEYKKGIDNNASSSGNSNRTLS